METKSLDASNKRSQIIKPVPYSHQQGNRVETGNGKKRLRVIEEEKVPKWHVEKNLIAKVKRA